MSTKLKTPAPASKRTEALVGNDTEAFRKTFDARHRVASALKKLGARWMYEGEFIKLCGLGTQQFAEVREHFKDYIAREPGNERDKRVWAGTTDYAAKLREYSDGSYKD